MTNLPPTKKQFSRYKMSDGSFCIYCNSVNIVSSQWEEDEWTATQEVECKDCGRKWKEIYVLTMVDVEALDVEDTQEDSQESAANSS